MSVNGVQAVSFSSNTPVEDGNNMWTTFKLDHSAKETDPQAIVKFADNEYVQTYKLQLAAGRNLQSSGLTREFLVNESLVKSLGFKQPEDILNKEISMWNGLIKCPVVGVLKDFNDRTFHHDLAPLLITTIHISWWVFAAGGFAAIIIAFVTISFQAIKAALANPVKSLRSE